MKKLLLALGLAVSLNASASIVVDLATAPDNIWVDSGIVVSPGETLSFSATGWWTISAPLGTPGSPATYDTGPDGLAGDPWPQDKYVSDALKGALIAFVGAAPAAPGTFSPAVPSGTLGYYKVGSSATISFPNGGELWFGINDGASSPNSGDNTGSVEVTVVPEPTTVLAGALLLLPFGVSVFRRLRRS